jgi:hypothetical protein
MVRACSVGLTFPDTFGSAVAGRESLEGGEPMKKLPLVLGVVLAFAAGISSSLIARQSATGSDGANFNADFGNKTISIRLASRTGGAAQVTVTFQNTKTAVLPFETSGQADVMVNNVTCASRSVEIFRLAYPDSLAPGKPVSDQAKHFWGAPTVMVTRNSPGSIVSQIITTFLVRMTSRNPEVCMGPKPNGKKDALPRVDGTAPLTILQIGTSNDYVFEDSPGQKNLLAGQKFGTVDLVSGENMLFENALETYFNTTCNGQSVPTFKVTWAMNVLNTIMDTRDTTTGRVLLIPATVTANPDITNLTTAQKNGNFSHVVHGLENVTCPP